VLGINSSAVKKHEQRKKHCSSSLVLALKSRLIFELRIVGVYLTTEHIYLQNIDSVVERASVDYFGPRLVGGVRCVSVSSNTLTRCTC
jgi:hypothetical protein